MAPYLHDHLETFRHSQKLETMAKLMSKKRNVGFNGFPLRKLEV